MGGCSHRDGTKKGVGLIASSDSPRLLSPPANSRRPPAWGATHTAASRSSSAQTSPFLCTCRKRQRTEEITGKKFWFKCVCRRFAYEGKSKRKIVHLPKNSLNNSKKIREVTLISRCPAPKSSIANCTKTNLQLTDVRDWNLHKTDVKFKKAKLVMQNREKKPNRKIQEVKFADVKQEQMRKRSSITNRRSNRRQS
ncbi:hypothetical protein LXL04_024840 [Taraxacum kok-saghyz]